MKIRNFYKDNGSVMLETILVLPMYLVFITVIFFSGEVSLYRNLLLQMDQHDLWAVGTRNNSSTSSVAEKLFGTLGTRDFMGDFEITAQDKDAKTLSSNEWWQKNSLKNNAVLKVPGWIKSVRILVSNHPVNYKEEFKLRENDDKLALYSRNETNAWRNNCQSGEDLCKQQSGKEEPGWMTVVNENYAGKDNVPSKISGKAISAYERQIPAYGVFTGEQ